MTPRPDAHHIVCGAGAAGLSLAAALVRAGVRDPITLVDRRKLWEDDRTWCFWDTGDVALSGLARHRWRAWSVTTERRTVVGRAGDMPYVHLQARHVYDRLLDELDAAPNVSFRLGARVRAFRQDDDGVTVATDLGPVPGSMAWDALGGGGPGLRGRPDGDVELRQRFLGQEVEVERPVFDVQTVTLMDFRVGQQDGLHFVYVLPFSPTRALVEDTHVQVGSVPAAARRKTIAAHLARLGAGEVRVVAEERGAIPMTTHRFAAVRGPRVAAVGTAAGAVRPSSGYAWVRMQRHIGAVAAAVAAGAPLPDGPGNARTRALDDVFLRALAAAPGAFGERFASLVDALDGDAFARFMSDAASPTDELRAMAALPPLPFVVAALRGAR